MKNASLLIVTTQFICSCASTRTVEEVRFQNQFLHNGDLQEIQLEACLKKHGFESRDLELKYQYEMDSKGAMKSVEIDSADTHGSNSELNECIVTNTKKINHGDQIGGGGKGSYTYRFNH